MTENKQMKELELYFHIPFCVKKCEYCDFLSFPADRAVRKAYMEALTKETRERAAQAAGCEVTSIFIGGGTPSVVEGEEIAGLMETARAVYCVSPDAEVTIEVNPGTVGPKKLQCYRKAGINRISIGLQSALDGELKRLGRIHTYEQFLDTYHAARQAGFTNINLDIISAIPDQGLKDYHRTLDQILSLQPLPEHISAYSLIVEEDTGFAREAEQGGLRLPDEDCERQMYEDTRDRLETFGYHRYEISNYALEGYACRHNCGYWRRTPYLGLGLGAASLMGNTRFQNGRELQKYLENPLSVREGETNLSVREQMEEFMFLGLRMTKGVSRREFQGSFGMPMEAVYSRPLERGQAEGLLNVEGDWVRLTDRGLDLSNYMMAQFLLDEG